MSLYTIADLHLSTAEVTNKPMEVFGKRWDDYTNRLERSWRALVQEEDTVVIPGDISWALRLDEALSDLTFLDRLPGKKLLGKGNHDFWWTTIKKNQEFFARHGLHTLSFLYNNACVCEDFILAGTRGWYLEADAQNAKNAPDHALIMAREGGRLRLSLEAAMELKAVHPEKEILVFTHFPPFWNQRPGGNLIQILLEYPLKRVFFGHIHGNYALPPVFYHEGLELHLCSADYLSFIPKAIRKEGEVQD